MNISKSALARHVAKFKNTVDVDNIIFRKDLVSGMVSTTDQETMQNDYLLTSSYMNYGLDMHQVQKLAYQYANGLNLKIRDSWKSTKIAGKDWFCGFMDRHPKLSPRSPEATSFGRGTSFNKANVASFHKNLKTPEFYSPDTMSAFERAYEERKCLPFNFKEMFLYSRASFASFLGRSLSAAARCWPVTGPTYLTVDLTYGPCRKHSLPPPPPPERSGIDDVTSNLCGTRVQMSSNVWKRSKTTGLTSE
ncbi:hypothetical protein JTE90_025058 [Oedothorax gibbosus]|uniref:HTH CENPB-type domain-containing protein n=1 Tax=Oedothorax gibbosus TaxID=931172 RepID=A0AAV6TS32_9ARAC|nr:hypothetical protein JTE90_025058 [Oedothorax gibbosus]